MNERILQLALQAGMTKVLNEHAAEYGAGQFDNTQYPELEKFAALIAQDCISIVEKQKERLCEEQHHWSEHDFGYEMAVNDASGAIKQFFGVEE